MSKDVTNQEFEDGNYTGTINIETGLREGLGKFEYSKASGWKYGCIYNGYWENDMFHGHATLLWANGKIWYEGDFKNNKKTGSATLYYVSGNIWFRGNFDEDLKHGTGTIYFDNKNNSVKYTGEFSKDQYHGFGTLSDDKEFIIFAGIFENNEYHTVGKLFFKSSIQVRYEGGWHKGKYHGKGVLFYKDNSDFPTSGKRIGFFGSYDMGKKSGYGESYDRDTLKLQYRGYFKDDKRCGLGLSFYCNGYNQNKGKEIPMKPECLANWEDNKVNGFISTFHSNSKQKVIGGFFKKPVTGHYYTANLNAITEKDKTRFKKNFCQSFASDGTIIGYGSYENAPDQVWYVHNRTRRS